RACDLSIVRQLFLLIGGTIIYYLIADRDLSCICNGNWTKLPVKIKNPIIQITQADMQRAEYLAAYPGREIDIICVRVRRSCIKDLKIVEPDYVLRICHSVYGSNNDRTGNCGGIPQYDGGFRGFIHEAHSLDVCDFRVRRSCRTPPASGPDAALNLAWRRHL